ncbi:MAG TPA: hypothetical protein VFA77_07120 [Candidatus Eisenbacteria bacterium]|nr:hypothetical protein [Candidatus Eisenbacteria bacterium]
MCEREQDAAEKSAKHADRQEPQKPWPCGAICRRKPYTLPAVPIVSASVLVALAMIGGVPSNSRTGKVMSVPPPATALTIPAAPAAATNVIASLADIFVHRSLHK